MGLLATETAPVPNLTSDFIDEHFKTDGRFDADKVTIFIEELRDRRTELLQQVFDTRFSEKVRVS